MDAKEIDNKLKEGESLIVHFGIRKYSYFIGKNKITEKQYNAAKNRFKDKLEFTSDWAGLTMHFYKIKTNK